MNIQLPDNLRVQHFMAKEFTYDTCVALKIFCVGDPTTYADPQVVFGTHDFLFYSNYTTGAVLDTHVFQTSVTAGHLETDKSAANLTVYAVAALINASANWRAVVVGAMEDTLAYTHAGTLQHFLPMAADSAQAIACRTNVGTSVFFDTSVAAIATACIGLEAMDDETLWPGIARVQGNTLPRTDRERDVANLPVAGARVYQVMDRAAFLTYCYAAAGDGSGSALAADFIRFYAADQKGSRLLKTIAGPGNNANNSTTAELALPLITRNGERLVVTWAGTNMGAASVNPAIKVAGGVGILRG